MKPKSRVRYATLALAASVLLLLVLSKPAAAGEPNGIVNPAEGETLSGLVPITGVADDPAFAAWQLDLLPTANPRDTIFVARGTDRSEVPSNIGRIDTARYPDGDYRLRLRVIRTDSNYSEYFTGITIANGPLGPNGITMPIAGSTVTCLTTIEAIARGDNFLKRQVDVLVGGDENKVLPIGRGNDPRYSEGLLAQFDTTLVPDGNHVLRLRVVRQDGNYDTYYTPVVVDNHLLAAALSRKSCGCSVPSPDAVPTEPNGFSNPPDGTVVSGTFPLCGTAYDANLATWEVALLPGGDENQAIVVGLGNSANLTRAPFTLLDTTALPDGKYGLRLRVARTDYTFAQYSISICVSNHRTGTGAQTCR